MVGREMQGVRQSCRVALLGYHLTHLTREDRYVGGKNQHQKRKRKNTAVQTQTNPQTDKPQDEERVGGCGGDAMCTNCRERTVWIWVGVRLGSLYRSYLGEDDMNQQHQGGKEKKQTYLVQWHCGHFTLHSTSSLMNALIFHSLSMSACTQHSDNGSHNQI